jgi:hypothetical protein
MKSRRFLRRRSQQPPPTSPPSKSLKDGLTVAISILALVISATTAYLSVLLKEDDLRVVVEVGPDISYSKPDQKLYFDRAQKLAFINAGNRTILINRLGAVFAKDGRGKDGGGFILTECQYGIDVELYYDYGPIKLFEHFHRLFSWVCLSPSCATWERKD